jgi:prepilin-type N-terminal cleavage/methylation domain-containing protein
MRALLSTSSRAFTLIEVMVAASIGLIILLGATNIATTMVRTTRIAGDAQALTTRAQLARNLLVPMLAATGDAWRVDNAFKTPFDSTSGAPGEAHCAPSTNLCTGPQIYPLRITDGGPGGSDSVRAIVPRPGPLESVQIKTLAGGVGIPVTCAGLPNVVAFDVQGTTTVPLAVGDLVILSKRDHVTVGVLATALPADASDPPITRTLSIDVGPVAELEFDDGGRTNCSAQSSYGNAFVVPVSVIDIRHNVHRSFGRLRALMISKSDSKSRASPPTANPAPPRSVPAKPPTFSNSTPAMSSERLATSLGCARAQRANASTVIRCKGRCCAPSDCSSDC